MNSSRSSSSSVRPSVGSLRSTLPGALVESAVTDEEILTFSPFVVTVALDVSLKSDASDFCY